MCTGEPAEKTTPFMATYAKTHPIGIYLLRQWNLFKSMQEDALQQKSKIPHDLKIGVEEGDPKTFANDENTACTFDEVSDVGTSFLAFIKEELGKKNWGGTFNYNMSGRGKKGYMHVTATVEVGNGHPDSTMDIKPYFHII
eukprot:Tbor_TRINITY_DN5619_c0_g6::TRINITY_DN5619_c0_g6_i1::g.8394::m.8394